MLFTDVIFEFFERNTKVRGGKTRMAKKIGVPPSNMTDMMGKKRQILPAHLDTLIENSGGLTSQLLFSLTRLAQELELNQDSAGTVNVTVRQTTNDPYAMVSADSPEDRLMTKTGRVDALVSSFVDVAEAAKPVRPKELPAVAAGSGKRPKSPRAPRGGPVRSK